MIAGKDFLGLLLIITVEIFRHSGCASIFAHNAMPFMRGMFRCVNTIGRRMARAYPLKAQEPCGFPPSSRCGLTAVTLIPLATVNPHHYSLFAFAITCNRSAIFPGERT